MQTVLDKPGKAGLSSPQACLPRHAQAGSWPACATSLPHPSLSPLQNWRERKLNVQGLGGATARVYLEPGKPETQVGLVKCYIYWVCG